MKEPATFNDVIYKRRSYQRIFEFDYDISGFQYAGGLLDVDFVPFTITKLDNKRIMVELSKSVTADFVANSQHQYDIKEVAGGLEATLIKGIITIEDSVTP